MCTLPEVNKKILIQREGTLGVQRIFELIQTYENVSLNDFPNMLAEKRAHIQEMLSSQPNAQEQAEWSQIEASKGDYKNDMTQAEVLSNVLSQYISRWGSELPTGNHVAEANSLYAEVSMLLSNYRMQKEEAEWQALDINSNIDLQHYLQLHPDTSHLAEIDELYWNNINKEAVAEIEAYINHPHFSRFKAEAADIKNSLVEWMQVKYSSDILVVANFVRNHTQSPFASNAQLLLLELKQQEIRRMQDEPNKYEPRTLLQYISDGVFTKYELINADVMTESVYETLSDPDLNEILQ